jgi:uncharacterized YccA/Bax inhibitor family protein
MSEEPMQSRNPVLSKLGTESSNGSGFAYDEGKSAFQAAGTATSAQAQFDTMGQPYSGPVGVGARMTMNDVIVKSAILLIVTILFAVVGWNITSNNPGLGMIMLVGTMFVGLGLGFANSLMKKINPVLVLAYAVVEGLFLGAISFQYNQINLSNDYPGAVQQAIIGTFVAFAVMLALYGTGIIKASPRFKKMMMIAMVSYLAIGIVSLISSFFGVGGGWGFYGVGAFGIALCAIGVALAAFSLVMDFEAITRGIEMGLPERESWRMGFGLLVTLIWLYLEILRLITILASNR